MRWDESMREVIETRAEWRKRMMQVAKRYHAMQESQ